MPRKVDVTDLPDSVDVLCSSGNFLTSLNGIIITIIMQLLEKSISQ